MTFHRKPREGKHLQSYGVSLKPINGLNGKKKVQGTEATDTIVRGDMCQEHPTFVRLMSRLCPDTQIRNRMYCLFKNQAPLKLTICNHGAGQFSGESTGKCPVPPYDQSATASVHNVESCHHKPITFFYCMLHSLEKDEFKLGNCLSGPIKLKICSLWSPTNFWAHFSLNFTLHRLTTQNSFKLLCS